MTTKLCPDEFQLPPVGPYGWPIRHEFADIGQREPDCICPPINTRHNSGCPSFARLAEECLVTLPPDDHAVFADDAVQP